MRRNGAGSHVLIPSLTSLASLSLHTRVNFLRRDTTIYPVENYVKPNLDTSAPCHPGIAPELKRP